MIMWRRVVVQVRFRTWPARALTPEHGNAVCASVCLHVCVHACMHTRGLTLLACK